ncbi:hypothetical protein [Lichenibacterium dinghuense]|uniref:hypothetical protein n=1 Tax=Lichenibacterium dinghuense TaxID=2895977 RepID=UPI001F295E9A|nr:hypothetical protein [Lichenibacterium sp. 6Y81]
MAIERSRKSILCEAWRLARATSTTSGRPAREHLAEAQRDAWRAARCSTADAVLAALSAAIDAEVAIHADEQDAAEARARYMHRQLGEALEYGFALLDALDLGPMALDVVDNAIAALDALDAPHEDLKPWLTGPPHPCFAMDAEDDSEKDEGTALERHGCGFIRAGEDDAEDDDPGEEDFRAHRPILTLRPMVAHG